MLTKVALALSVVFGVFSAEEARDLCSVQNRIKKPDQVFLAQDRREQDLFYRRGSLWISESTIEGMRFLYYYEDLGQEETKPRKNSVMHSCSFHVSGMLLPEALLDLSGLIGAFASSAEKDFAEFVSCAYPSIPKCDIVCATICRLKEVLSNKKDTCHGVLHPRFCSWARYVSMKQFHASDKIVFGDEGRHKPGDVWLSVEQEKTMLLYRADFEHEWLTYCCDLEQKDTWPENWFEHLGILQKFAKSDKKFLEDFAREKSHNIAAVVKACLSGRAASFCEKVWFVWGPRSSQSISMSKSIAVRTDPAPLGLYISQAGHIFQWRPTAPAPNGTFSLCGIKDAVKYWPLLVEGFIEELRPECHEHDSNSSSSSDSDSEISDDDKESHSNVVTAI